MLIGAANPVYLAAEPIDMRKSIDGFAQWVQASLPASPLCGALFVFFNRARDKVKLLWWDRHGFWLAYKRLDRRRFAAARSGQITLSELTTRHSPRLAAAVRVQGGSRSRHG